MRNTDEQDPFREKTVQMLDDFKISGVNGTRILSEESMLCYKCIIRLFKSNAYLETLSITFCFYKYVSLIVYILGHHDLSQKQVLIGFM